MKSCRKVNYTTRWLTSHTLPTANAWDPLPHLFSWQNRPSSQTLWEKWRENELFHFLGVVSPMITTLERLSGASAFLSDDTFLHLHWQDSYIAGSICENDTHELTTVPQDLRPQDHGCGAGFRHMNVGEHILAITPQQSPIRVAGIHFLITSRLILKPRVPSCCLH